MDFVGSGCPSQIDCVWLATDTTGRLAAMVTAGEGPIPTALLGRNVGEVDVEQLLLDLPIIGEAQIAAQIPHPESFVALSMRGLFVYDWTDVHRTRSAAKQAYELVCLPTIAISQDDLSGQLLEAACRVPTFFGSAFVSLGGPFAR